MSDRFRPAAGIGLALLVVAGTACEVTTKPSRFVRHFVPPSPQPPVAAAVVEEAPALDPALFAKESPNLLAEVALLPARSLEAQQRVLQADGHYQAGLLLAGRGDMDGARVEFDRALETLILAPVTLPEQERLRKKYDELVEQIYRAEAESAQGGAAEAEPVFDKTPVEDIARMTFPVEPGLKGRVKEQLQITRSQLPLELADPVLGYINYFSTPKGNQIVAAGLRRSGRYAPMIRRILDEEGLPPELIFMAQAESAFLPRAVSRKAATGMWQFVKFRGIEYGLRQTAHTDDRLDPERATRAAARHLKDLYAQFGDWYLAMAAYNCGPGNVERGIQRTGYADFWQLYSRNVLPRETANYLPIILAMIIMAKNPGAYGLDGIRTDAPFEPDTITLTAPAHLALIADIAKVPLATMREMNPSVLRATAPAAHYVHVPKGSAKGVLAALESVPATKRLSWRVHRVGPLESVASIAKVYRIPEKSLQEVNGRNLLSPEPGDLLVVPVSYPGVAEPKRVKRRAQTAEKHGTARARGGTTAKARVKIASRETGTAGGKVQARLRR